MKLRADFHMHSCLSPCGTLDMSPSAIACLAREAGLHVAALTDHNCALNCPAFKTACEREGILPLFGMEVTTIEEAHVVCLFDRLETVLDFGAEVYGRLDDFPNNPDRFGDQVIVNADDEVEGFVEKLLIGATDFEIGALGRRVHELGGLFIPSHVDRAVYSVIGQLGFLPPDDYDAIEISADGLFDLSLAGDYPVVSNSDAHQPSRIGVVWNELEVDEFSIESLRAALKAGRSRICC